MARIDIRAKPDAPIDEVVVSDDLVLKKSGSDTWTLESVDNGEEIEIGILEMEHMKKALDFIQNL